MSNQLFQNVPFAKLPKTAFDLSHEHKLTGDMGKLYPVLCQEVVPGDKFTINSSHLIRFSPLVSPVMHKIDAYIHYFYVPCNLIDPNFETMIAKGGGQQTAEDVPHIDVTTVVKGSLADYLGLPLMEIGGSLQAGPDAVKVSQYPFRVYQLIWNEYYRDQNFETELKDFNSPAWNTQIGEYCTTSNIKFRAWEKDYFTSALPYAQKGEPSAAVVDIDTAGGSVLRKVSDNSAEVSGSVVTLSNGVLAKSGVGVPDYVDTEMHIDVNEIRRANALQKYIEKIYRVGSRYIEYLKGVWGVESDDLTLKRPQYIGGGKTPVVVSEVLNMNGRDLEEDTGALPQGSMSGHALSVGNSNNATVYCKYHGYIMGIMSVMPQPAYHMGIHRMWSRFNNLDFYTPDFANLGEQEVLNKELYVKGYDHVDDAVFGYQQRYAEYKYAMNSVHGEFRDTLEHWHMARGFADTPTLNTSFIHCDPTKRIFALLTEPNSLYITVWHNIVAVRPMPLQPIPGL